MNPLADQSDQSDDSYKFIRRSIIKLPNPESFSGSDGQSFDTFEEQMRNKLEVNYWMFPDERTRFAWLTSLFTGDARSMLSPHLKHHNPLRFTTMEQILDLFRLSYSNPNEINEAKNKLAALIIKESDEFYVFCAEFVKLASFAGTPLTE
jgi:hypothetical protein